MNTAENLPEHAVRHREEFERYVIDHSEGWMRPFLLEFYDHWHRYNEQFFEGKMTTPYILIAVPTSARAMGDCSLYSSFGGRSQIRIRPTVLNGKADCVRSGDEFIEGRIRIGSDILLHEMVHQWQQEITHNTEYAFRGHGNGFRDKCNEIGVILGLPPVRNEKKRGKDKDLPSCTGWPHNVRPTEYYLGALIPNSRPVDVPDEKDNKEATQSPDSVVLPLNVDGAAEVIKRHFKGATLAKLLETLEVA